jgi:phage terminase large subunit-like protein
MWWLVTGTHPYRPGPPLKEGWIVIPDLSGDWPKLSTKIRSLQPGEVLAPRCRYDPVRGYVAAGRIGIELKNGAVITPKSGTQDPLAVEGGTVDWIWVDEPPKRAHWHALPQRVAVRGGLIWLTFTPIGRPLGWLREYFEGNPDSNPPTPPAPGWSEIRLRLTPENCPHRSPGSISEQVAAMSPWELKQRRDGEWEGLTEGRRFVAFGEGCLAPDSLIETFKASFVRLSWDHGEGTDNQVGYLLFGDGLRWVVADEVISERGSTPAMDARRAIDMLTRWGLTVDHVTEAYGDTNSAGKAGAGASVNALLEAAIADLSRRSKAPFEIRRPNKRAGSVAAGERAINSLFREGRLFTSPRTPSLNNALQHYTGTEKDLKHPIDALRYGLSDILLSPSNSTATSTATRLIVV